MNRNGLFYLMGTNMIAYVKMKGFQEIDIEFTDDKRVKYWFKEQGELHSVIEEFKNNQVIQDFVNQQNIVKRKIIKLRDENGKQ